MHSTHEPENLATEGDATQQVDIDSFAELMGSFTSSTPILDWTGGSGSSSVEPGEADAFSTPLFPPEPVAADTFANTGPAVSILQDDTSSVNQSILALLSADPDPQLLLNQPLTEIPGEGAPSFWPGVVDTTNMLPFPSDSAVGAFAARLGQEGPRVPVLPPPASSSVVDDSTLSLVHVFLPLFPLPRLKELVAGCTESGTGDICALFFVSALETLATSMSADRSPTCAPYLPSQIQDLAMRAYFTVHSQAECPPPSARTEATSADSDSSALAAAGLLYLALASIFTSGLPGLPASPTPSLSLSPSSAARTYIRLGACAATQIRDAALQRTFARAAWLWSKAAGGTVAPQSVVLATEHRGASEAGAMDEAQHEFDAFVDLCVDLDVLIAGAARAGGDVAEAELYAHVGLPLCERVRVWAQESRAAGECLLQFGQIGRAHV